MNCHGGNNQDHNHHVNEKKGHGRHMLLMVLGCAIPIVLLLLLPVFKINSPAIKSFLPFAVLLLCPLMHIFMMPMMSRKNKNVSVQENNHVHPRQIEDGKGEI